MQSTVEHSAAEVLRVSDSAAWAPPPGDVRSAPFRTG
ncbi:hypothetical protein JOC24_006194 [Streptomyces sp. HB132]|nr:hypothetical protein [Streptomyces sp. HB132]